MKLQLLLLLTAAAAMSQVDGVVTNRTTGRPQSGVSVTLMQLSGGMDQVASARTDAQGRFRMDYTPPPNTPLLLQALHDAVTYNRLLQPGLPTTGVTLNVWNATRERGDAKVSQHMILIEPSEGQISINESIVYENPSNATWQDPEGTLRFHLPPAAQGKVNVSASSQGGMPINRQAEKTTEPDAYVVKFPVKPGETRFDLAYTLPSAKEFESKLLHGGGPLRLVAPKGVTLTGEGIESLGPEPRTQATVYNVTTPSFRVSIEGVGSLRAAMEQQQQTDDGSPSIEQQKPRIYQKLAWVLALVGAILAAGFFLLLRAESGRR